MTKKIERCTICDSPDSLIDEKVSFFLNLVDPFTFHRCKVCDFLWLNPQPTKNEYNEIYSTAYPGAQNVRISKDLILSMYPPKEERYEEEVVPLRVRYFRARLKKLRKLAPNGRTLLDIGAGTGEFVALAAEEGWKAEGVEVSKYACEMAYEKHKITLLCSDIDEYVQQPHGKFDVVHLSHSFEHLLKPREFLLAARKLLSPSGVIIIEVPNLFRNWCDSLANFKNNVKQIERSTFSIHHPFNYGIGHVRSLLYQCGYEVILARTFFSERMYGGPKEICKGLVDFFGDIVGGHGRNIEVVATIS